MPKYAVVVRKSDDAIIGDWTGGKNTIPVADPAGDTDIFEVTQAGRAQVQGNKFFVGATTPRFLFQGGGIQLQVDGRPFLRGVSLLVDQGGAPGMLNLETIDRQTLLLVPLNVTWLLLFSDARRVKTTFVNGAATVTVKVSKAYQVRLQHTEDYEVENAITVEVVGTDLEP